MKRFRHRVKKMSSTRDRMCYAKRICVKINKKLKRGWSLLAEDKNSYFTKLYQSSKFRHKKTAAINSGAVHV